jgi:hypothetical protein
MLLVWILFAFIKEKSINECLDIALKLAALKLQNVGRYQIILTFFLNFINQYGNNKNISNGVMLNAYQTVLGKI